MKLKTLLSNRWVQSIIATLISYYLKFVVKTSYVEIKGRDHFESLPKDRPVLFASWHGRLLMIPFLGQTNKPCHAVISTHKDGVLIAKVARFLGHQVIEGSTNKRSLSALRKIFAVLDKNEYVYITPDGPRGPVRQVSGAIINIATKCNALIIPVSFSAKRKKIWRSWDQFLVCYPFNHIVLAYGTPYLVDPNGDLDVSKTQLEKSLNTLTDSLDGLFQ